MIVDKPKWQQTHWCYKCRDGAFEIIEINKNLQSTITELENQLKLEKEANTRNMIDAGEMMLNQAKTITELEGKLERARPLTYQEAKKACELFEYEWIGQVAGPLWDWCVNEAIQQLGDKQ